MTFRRQIRLAYLVGLCGLLVGGPLMLASGESWRADGWKTDPTAIVARIAIAAAWFGLFLFGAFRQLTKWSWNHGFKEIAPYATVSGKGPIAGFRRWFMGVDHDGYDLDTVRTEPVSPGTPNRKRYA